MGITKSIIYTVVSIILIASIFFGTRVFYDWEKKYLTENTIEVPSNDALKNVRFLEISKHTFEHRKDCACKLLGE